MGGKRRPMRLNVCAAPFQGAYHGPCGRMYFEGTEHDAHSGGYGCRAEILKEKMSAI